MLTPKNCLCGSTKNCVHASVRYMNPCHGLDLEQWGNGFSGKKGPGAPVCSALPFCPNGSPKLNVQQVTVAVKKNHQKSQTPKLSVQPSPKKEKSAQSKKKTQNKKFRWRSALQPGMHTWGVTIGVAVAQQLTLRAFHWATSKLDPRAATIWSPTCGQFARPATQV